jgi:putative DNA methylase
MAVFSKYAAVLEADGNRMSVHTALTLINRVLTEGGEAFDADTHFCLAWFDEMGWNAGEFGKADVLARAKGTSVDGLRDAGVVEAISGKVRLLKTVEYPSDWDPAHDNRTPVWEALHQMIRALQSAGETAAGSILARLPQSAESIRSLAYRLFTLCERKSWTDEARGYNDLITSWLGIESASHEAGWSGSQTQLEI